MARRQSTKIQITGEKYARKRYRNACTSGIPDETDDPINPHDNTMMWGAAALLLICMIAFMLHMMQPAPDQGQAAIMQTKSGGLYVTVDEVDAEGQPTGASTVHPALNLASARLASGSASKPSIIDDDDLAESPRGLPIGIVGAPNNLTYHPPAETVASFGVCDSRSRDSDLALTTTEKLSTTVVAGVDTWKGGQPLGDGQGIVAKPADSGTTYLLWGNAKAPLPDDPRRVLSAVGLPPAAADDPQPISQEVLGAMSARPELAPPEVEGAGEVSEVVKGQTVGAILRAENTGGERSFYVVFDDGIQAIPPVVAELLSSTGAQILTVTDPENLADVPTVEHIRLSNYPSESLDLVAPEAICSVWEEGPTDTAPRKHIVTGQGLPITPEANERAVRSLESSGAPVATRFAAPSGKGWFVQVTGDDEGSRERGQVAYIDDTGVRYDLVPGDGESYADLMKSLGFEGQPTPIPDGVARILPQGPNLSRKAAMVEHVYDAEAAPTVTVTQTPAATPTTSSSEPTSSEEPTDEADGEEVDEPEPEEDEGPGDEPDLPDTDEELVPPEGRDEAEVQPPAPPQPE